MGEAYASPQWVGIYGLLDETVDKSCKFCGHHFVSRTLRGTPDALLLKVVYPEASSSLALSW